MTTLVRSTVDLFERPDRMVKATLAALPWGASPMAAIAAAVAREPDRPAIIDHEGELTYQALWKRSDAIADALQQHGAGPGIAVGVLFRNGRGFAEAVMAATKTGADVVLLNTGFAGPQFVDVVNAEAVAILVHDDEFDDHATLCPTIPSLNGTALRKIAENGTTVPPTRHQGRTVILTSGTTGRPRGASRSAGAAAIEGVAALLERIPLRPRDVQVVAAPLFHAWGLSHLMLGLARCATTIVAPSFDAEATLANVSKYRARVFVVVPVMLQRVLALAPDILNHAETTSLEVVAVSGSALGSQLATDVADRWGAVLYNLYGSTEVAVASVATPADLRRSPTTVGHPAPGVRVEILDDHARPVPAGVVGRIFVGNSAKFDGYTGGGGKETHRGLLSSGDVGHFDDDNLLYVDGRDDDMIVSGGENVFPQEVGDLLEHHPDITEVAVVGISDDRFGQALAAYVVRRHGSALDADAVKRFVRTNLAVFKVPRQVIFLAELPRNASGKIQKSELPPPEAPEANAAPPEP